MTMKTASLAVGASIVIALGIVSCESRKQTTPQSPTQPAPVTAGLARVELIAPGSIAPADSVQLTANAVKSDNSVEDVTGQAQWFSSNRRVVEVSASGTAKGVAPGETIISVSYQSRGASAHTFVLPTGTYRLAGRVSEGNLGLSGVTITVIGGVGEGLSTVTDGTGAYTLLGVRDRVRLQAKLGGYFNRIEEVDVTDHRTFNFEMVPERLRTDVRGNYRLTIAGAACSDSLPQTRTYDATVSQDGSQLTVALTGADFILTQGRGNRFSGTIDAGDRITFSIGNASFYYYYLGQYDLVERISDTDALIVYGIVTARPSSTGISGTLNGELLLTQGIVAPFTRIQMRCYSAAHRFEMVRR